MLSFIVFDSTVRNGLVIGRYILHTFKLTLKSTSGIGLLDSIHILCVTERMNKKNSFELWTFRILEYIASKFYIAYGLLIIYKKHKAIRISSFLILFLITKQLYLA